jgi:type II secretory ATPase GspE/PulE/Tfp pilus assembly ATPase PilB-like protein
MTMTNENADTLVADLHQHTLSPLPDPLKSMLYQAILENATDIHIHTYEREFCVFFRVDGTVYRKQCLSSNQGRQLINQVKSAAQLDVTQTFHPEEGQIVCREDGTRRDIRVTAIPVGKETGVHLRFLAIPDRNLKLSSLGLSEDQEGKVKAALEARHGLILVSGTTGSGKTTTLYALASCLNSHDATVYSIEDPVEFRLPFAQQMDVNEAQGLTMYQGLRTILRMDPDVILIGEIRDPESAVAAARAALSGRLVLATIHGRDALAALEAFHYLSVPNYIIGSSTRLIIAQRLVRRLCKSCAEPRPPTEEERQLFEEHQFSPPDTVPQASGCEACNDYGYQGRTGLFEMVSVEKELALKISQGTHRRDLESYLTTCPSEALMREALIKVKQGVTSLQETFLIASQDPGTGVDRS